MTARRNGVSGVRAVVADADEDALRDTRCVVSGRHARQRCHAGLKSILQGPGRGYKEASLATEWTLENVRLSESF